jgi:hypothetical protein
MTHQFRFPAAAIVALAAVLSPAGPAAAQPSSPQLPCGSRAEIIDILENNYGERRIAHGQAHTGAVAEIFVGPKGTWSIAASAPNGKSCLIGTGDTWTPVETVGNEI